jgi:transcriptional regulator with XRE-family HTH domain
MEQSFGTRLRLQRERQQVSLTTIAERTKIKASLLEGLERDDVSQWPSGIFRRSYVRTYAHAIGLDPDAVVREFLERYPEPVEDVTAAIAAARRRPPTRLGLLIGSAFGALPVRRPQPDPRRGVPLAEAVATADDHPGTPALAEAFDAALGTQQPEGSAAGMDPGAVEQHPGMSTSAPAPPVTLDLGGVAHLCTRLGCATRADEVEAVLDDAVKVLHAVGVILWASDSAVGDLWPVLSGGYPQRVLARMPRVARDEDNAIATAFRAGDACVVHGGANATGAIVVPVLAPSGCSGVLAIEFDRCGEQRDGMAAVAAILAAQLSAFIESAAAVSMGLTPQAAFGT